MRAPRPRRDGMSLLEVLIALATFTLAIGAIVFLMGVASNAAAEAQMRSAAISIAQSRLAEASAGVISLDGKPMGKCDDDGDYEWAMDVDSGAYAGLSTVTVRVRRKRANGTYLECALSQMVFDPTKVGTVFDAAQDPSSSTQSGSGGSSGVSGSPGGSAPMSSGPSPPGSSPPAGSRPSGSKTGG